MRRPILMLVLLMLCGSALAHPGHPGEGALAGLWHPLSGADHLLAMVAVGLWAACQRGAARWALPLSFVAFMLAGFLSPALPGVEPMIAVSVLTLGLAVAAAVRLPAWAGAAIVAAFALFHGNAHVAELPAGAHVAGFAAGMLLTTALLHAAGVGLGLSLGRANAWLPRALGGAVSVFGTYLLLA